MDHLSGAVDYPALVAAVEPDFEPPRQTHESGQIVLDRRRHLDSMLLALMLMAYPNKTFEVMMDGMGVMGDKEVFAWAATALGKEYAVIQPGVTPAGTNIDGQGFVGHTMAQHGPDGQLQFLHANFPEWRCESAPRLPLAENQRFSAFWVAPQRPSPPSTRGTLREYLSRAEWAATGAPHWPALETTLWALVKGLCSAM